MKMIEIKVTPTKQELISSAAEFFLESGKLAIQKADRFSVALSGGSTPLPVYRYLSRSDLDGELDWNKVHFFWGDERLVKHNHPESNYGQAADALLRPRNIPPGNIHRIKGELPPQEAARAYQQEIVDHFSDTPPRFDLILLGMGSDGHTASLFPGTRLVEESDQEEPTWVGEVYVPRLDAWRISFTPSLINPAHRILFLVSGSEKSSTLRQVLDGPDQPHTYPAQLIKGNITWIIDQEAAAALEIE